MIPESIDLQRPQNSFLSVFMCVLVILTNVSQMPIFVDSGITQYLSVPVWGILFIYCIFTKRYPKIQAFNIFVYMLVFFAVFYMMASSFNEVYTRSSLPGVIFLAAFVLFCSSASADSLNNADLNRIFTCYILSVFVVGWSVYKTYIAINGSIFVESRSYLYDSKNSISQILLSAWILILFTKMGTRLWIRIGYIFVMLFLTYELLMLQSRASIIGMPVALMFAVWKGNVSKNTKVYAELIIIAVIIALFFSDVYTYVRDYVIFAGRDVGNINDLSSGRSNEWIKFFVEFDEHPLFGVGRCKRESLILTSLLEFGIVGGIPILLMALSPFLFVIKEYKVMLNDTIFIILIVITLTYLLNGVFEQLAPFGPGAKCFLLWFLYGVLATKCYDGRYC